MFVQSFISNGKLILIQNETCGKGQIRFSDETANLFLSLLRPSQAQLKVLPLSKNDAGVFLIVVGD